MPKVYSGRNSGSIMDAKVSCLVKGLIGVIFGLLAIVIPDTTLATFLALFWVLIGLGLIICVFLAITSHSEGSLFWFLAATAFVVVAIVSFIFPHIVTIIFLIAIAILAFYSGLSGITLALTRPKSKYYLIGGTFVVAVVLLVLLLRYVPDTLKNPIMTFLGVFSLVFGVFSILMGMHIKEEPPVTAPLAKKQ
ncbi:MAG: hypothetical protein PHF57_01520 [Methanoregula sp.]|nr:hypothetical protein [Methanoregula sp.]MDD5186870.1 hypothetical protein [Methanoregula sp.]